MSIYKKLLQIQKEVMGLGEDKKSFGYKYVSGSKVLSHIKPLMNKHGLILKQEIVDIENERQDYETKSKAKSEILTKIKMRFTWVDCETGETDVNLFAANGQNDWEKGLGSALTYGERYFLLKYFHISTDGDDIDNPNRKVEDKEVKKPTSSKAVKSRTAISDINAFINILGTDKKDKAYAQAVNQRYITAEQAKALSGVLSSEEISKMVVK